MIVDALKALGKPATAPQIYKQISLTLPYEPLGNTPVATIRARLQEACPQSIQFQHRSRLFRRVSPVESRQGLWSLLEQADIPAIDYTLSDLAAVANDDVVSETQRQILAQARIGQGEFRRKLCVMWDSACAVTNVTVPHLLRASHIKPWKDSTNVERLDPNNGLLLIANLDAAFDKNIISFKDDGTIIFSSSLGEDPRATLGIQKDSSIRRKLNCQQKAYLRSHREKLK